MKVSKIKILLAILFFSLSFLFLLSILNHSLSMELMRLVLGATSVLLWAIIPTIVSILSLLVLGVTKEKFTFLVYSTTILVLISNMIFLLLLNLDSLIGLRAIFIAFFVWGSTILFVLALLIRLLYACLFKKNIKELMENMTKVKIAKLFLLSATVTFLLLQLFLIGSSIVAYKVVEASNIKEKSDYTLFSFYKPLISEIRLEDCRRWSYSRVKFVYDGQ